MTPKQNRFDVSLHKSQDYSLEEETECMNISDLLVYLFQRNCHYGKMNKHAQVLFLGRA